MLLPIAVDRIPDTGVLGWFLKPAQRLPWQPHQIAADDLRAALYEVSSSSILPVISERPEEEKIYLRHNPRKIGAFVERTSSLFLVVCGGDHKGKRLVNYKPRAYIEERKYVFPDSFLYLVFPESISEEYLNPHFRTRTKLSVPFKTASGVITRRIEGQEVSVLDYENPLNEIMNDIKCPIWVHGVRLPTEGDLAGLTPVLQSAG